MTGPQIGATASVSLVVRAEDCASALQLTDDPRDQYPEVFATTRMIALMEYAAAHLLHDFVSDGEMSVGVEVDVVHSAPTPVGAKVTATATYRGRDEKLFVFDVVAHDPAGGIGRGIHKRAIINRERLLAGAAKRASL